MNNPIWNRISKSEEAANLYLSDGLHLTKPGKKAIAAAWLNDINPTPIQQIIGALPIS
jgi:hypothetical protein